MILSQSADKSRPNQTLLQRSKLLRLWAFFVSQSKEAPRLSAKSKKTCVWCNAPIQGSRRSNRVYCSANCNKEAWNNKQLKLTGFCFACGEATSAGKFCSKACRESTVAHSCFICGNHITKPTTKKKYCSPACQKEAWSWSEIKNQQRRQKKKGKGFVYLINLEACEGLKIGRTNSMRTRVNSLSRSKGSKVEVIHFWEVSDSVKAEKLAHLMFDYCRIGNSENFRVEADRAIKVISKVLHVAKYIKH